MLTFGTPRSVHVKSILFQVRVHKITVQYFLMNKKIVLTLFRKKQSALQSLQLLYVLPPIDVMFPDCQNFYARIREQLQNNFWGNW